MNLIEELGLEKCKAIVDGAPDWATTYCTAYAAYGATFHWYGSCKNCYELPVLRTAIANPEKCQHEWNEITSNGDKYRFFVCKHCDSARNFAHLEEDHCTDIKNHISPNTKVIEHE